MTDFNPNTNEYFDTDVNWQSSKRQAMEKAYFHGFQEALRPRGFGAETVAEWEDEYEEYLQSCDEMELVSSLVFHIACQSICSKWFK